MHLKQLFLCSLVDYRVFSYKAYIRIKALILSSRVERSFFYGIEDQVWVIIGVPFVDVITIRVIIIHVTPHLVVTIEVSHVH